MKSLRLALRQPTSLYKGGRKRIKKSRTLYLNSIHPYKIPPSCLNGNPPPFTREAKSGSRGKYPVNRFANAMFFI